MQSCRKKRARARQRPALFSTVFPHLFPPSFPWGAIKRPQSGRKPPTAERPGLAAGQAPKGRRRGDPALCARLPRQRCGRTTSAQRMGGQRRRAAGEGFFFGARALCAPKKKMPEHSAKAPQRNAQGATAQGAPRSAAERGRVPGRPSQVCGNVPLFPFPYPPRRHPRPQHTANQLIPRVPCGPA